jgi:hypothetical protein
MTVIDVNTGNSQAKSCLRKPFSPSMRGLPGDRKADPPSETWGFHVIDFIVMGEEQHRQALLEA